MPKFEKGKGGCVLVEKAGWVEATEIYIERDKTKLTYDPRSELPPDAALMATLEADGWVGGCLTCRPRTDGTYEAADGRQRVSAVIEVDRKRRAAGLPGLQPLIYSRRMDDLEFLKVSAILNNVRIAENPDVSADRAKRMHDSFKMSISEIACYHGCSEGSVRNWLGLAEAPPAVRKAVREGRASMGTALAAKGDSEVEKAVAAAPTRKAAKRAVEAARPRVKPKTAEQIATLEASDGPELMDMADGYQDAGLNYHMAVRAAYFVGMRRGAGVA